MTNYVIDLISSKQFHIITHLEIDPSFITFHLTYLTFSVHFSNQLFELTF